MADVITLNEIDEIKNLLTGSIAVIGLGNCQSLLEATLLGLGNVGNANSIGRDTHLFDVFLQSLLHFVELAIDILQPIACYLLVLA